MSTSKTPRWSRSLSQRKLQRNRYRRARLEVLEQRWVLSAPTLSPIPDASVFQLAPFPVALDGFDADGDSLTYTVASSNPGALEVLTTSAGNRSLKIVMDGFGADGTDGEMVFQLFEDRAPATTARIIGLANQGFYNGVTFHRIIEDFMIQGGDPSGTGSGGTGYKFDDEFSTDLQFTRDGILAMANAGNDTNDSQFFITDAATRWLDYEHPIFGFLTSGDGVRQKVQAVATDNGVPLTPPVMKSVSVISDVQRDVILLKLKAGQVPVDPIDVTVTASDGHGNTAIRSFSVTPYADNGTYGNSHPFLMPVPTVEMTENTTASFPLSATDVEGDAARFLAEIKPSNPSITASADQNTGLVTVKATNDLAGVYGLYLQAYDYLASDTQSVPVWIDPAAPRSVALLNSSTSGGTVTDQDNSAGHKLQFQVGGVLAGTRVTIYADGQAIGSAMSTGTSVTVTTDGNHPLAEGTHTITAVQVLENQTPPTEAGNYHGQPRDLASQPTSGLAITVRLHNFASPGLYDPNSSTFYLRASNTTGSADYTFLYGQAGWTPLVGDWNGDAASDVALYDPATSRFYLSTSYRGGYAQYEFGYGVPGEGWIPLVGDWNGDGRSGVGLFDPHNSRFYLTNTLETGFAEYTFGFGVVGAGWTPLVGDWNGDGRSGVGLYDPHASMFYLTNSLETGSAQHTFGFGSADGGWQPLVGDWNGDRASGVGLYAPGTSTFYLTSAFSTGWAEQTFEYGLAGAGWQPLVGDWNGKGSTGVGLYAPSSSTFYLTNSLTGRYAEYTVDFGAPGANWQPLVGCWTTAAAAASTPAAQAVDQLDLASLARQELGPSLTLPDLGI